MRKAFLIATATLCCSSVFAQGLERKYESACACYIVTNHYSDGTLSSRHEENEKGQRNGTETVYFPSGQKQYERTWKNNRLDGTETHYHPDGAVYMQGSNAMGQRTGTWAVTDTEGSLIQEYLHNGAETTYKFYHAGVLYLSQTAANGELASETIHHREIYDQLKAEAEAAMLNKK